MDRLIIDAVTRAAAPVPVMIEPCQDVFIRVADTPFSEVEAGPAVIGDDATDVILAHLARPAGRWEPAGQSSGGWQSGTYVGGSGVVADISTVRFLKSCQAAQRSAHFVTFDGTLPQRQDRKMRFGYIFAIEQTDEGFGSMVTPAGRGHAGPLPPMGQSRRRSRQRPGVAPSSAQIQRLVFVATHA